MNKLQKVVELAELWLVPSIFLAYLLFFVIDFNAYYQSLREDRIAEWVTFWTLLAAGLVAVAAGWNFRRIKDRRGWFMLVLGLGLILASLEEISWGQRVIGIESPEFFLEYSDQQEVNVHNVLQMLSGVYLKDILGVGMVIFGIILPLLADRSWWRRTGGRWGIVLPPLALIPSWFLAAVLIIDWPTGEEEELGELLFSVCLLLFALGQLILSRRTTGAPGAEE